MKTEKFCLVIKLTRIHTQQFKFNSKWIALRCPIRIKFKDEDEKFKILSNSKLLKGTSISLNEDLPRAIVEDRKILHQAKLQAAKENKETRLKGDKLFIDNIPYIVCNKKLTLLNQNQNVQLL